MCGFIGYTHGKQELNHHKIIKDMMDTIIHRGPDNGGKYSDSFVTLGFRRLSIIDLSSTANQPIISEDGNIVLVFNGEIYNYMDLRQELLRKGYNFQTLSDSEVLIYGYLEYGFDIVKKLRGMFAFCIWDKNTGVLFLARDGFGIKPLYYTRNTTDGSILFGSEIKSFLPHPSFVKEFNKDALRPYLTFQYSVLDETFFKGVYKLPPAHYMVIEGDHISLHEYWDKKFHSKDESLEKYVKDTRNVLKDSVKAHQISDVEVGSFLSGGIDSSYIASLLLPSKTFSIGFNEQEDMFNETHLASELASNLGLNNTSKFISAEDAFTSLSDIQWHMDEPHGDPSIVPLYHLAKLASQEVKVVLSGEGADEIFGGYLWYKESKKMKLYGKLPYKLRKKIKSNVEKLPQSKITQFFVKGGQSVEERFIGQAHVWKEKDVLKVLNEAYLTGPSVETITRPIYQKVKSEDDLTKMQYLDLELWLPGDILLKADKMSMAHSLEVRVPFLDKNVMEMAKNIPSDYRVNDFDTKYVLRQAAFQTLPSECANREKLGFPVPIRHWLREEKYYRMVKEMFQSEFVSEFFNTRELMRYLDEHYKQAANHARYLWTVYVFLIWYKRFFIETE
ncbi:asparagine synthase (glutamine-hydrolyzing) [Lysinibacillus sp. M3]|uniref:asparagine synthase (glutamine-hydrolyzing) n=1 Tax=Lysinibacillus zambalensis TaxID=3160866 RepID=A0ABV1ML10_9BACI